MPKLMLSILKTLLLCCILSFPFLLHAQGAPAANERIAPLATSTVQNQCRNLCDQRYRECDADAEDIFSACECFNARVYCYEDCGIWPHPSPMTCNDGF